MNPLALLSELLEDAAQHSPVVLRPCVEIVEVLTQLEKQARAGGSNYEPRDLQVEAVKKFWDTREFESLREARLVSFGLAVRPWNDGRCLMEEPERFGRALAGLREWEGSPRQFRKCYQGLVRSYFDYDGLGRDVPEDGQKNWYMLRSYLGKHAPRIKDESINPDWVECVLENRRVFSGTPCEAYAQDLLEGRDARVNRVRELLGITDASWFTRELVLAQIQRACDQRHPEFVSVVERLLGLLAGNEVLRDRGLQMILNRYSQVPQTPQNRDLKNFSVNAWGNPWLPSNEHRWGGVSKKARQMVGDWLKLEFIELFFTKLAQDGLGDQRRIKFWQQYVPLIDDIRFALGRHTLFSRDRDFVALRDKLKGLIVPLESVNNRSDNAFIIFIADIVAVEFSNMGNAFYAYHKRTLPFDISMPLHVRVDDRNSLKQNECLLRLSHQDNAYSSWEYSFHCGLRPYLFSLENLRRIATRLGGDVTDHRPRGGALWITLEDLPEVRPILRAWGFRYAASKGWWKKDE